MITRGWMRVSHTEGCTLFTHSCISIDFLRALKNELTIVANDLGYSQQTTTAVGTAIDYFNDLHDYSIFTVSPTDHHTSIAFSPKQEDSYASQLHTLSTHLYDLAKH